MPLTLLWRGPDESPLGTCPGAGQSSVGLCHVPQSPVGRLRLLPRGGSAEVAAVTGSSTVLGRRPGSRGLRGVCGTQAALPRDSGGAWGSPRVLCPAVLWSDSAGPGICSGALRAVSLHDVHCSDQGPKPRSQKGRSPLIPIPRISKCSKGCGVCFPPMLLETFSKKRRGWAVGRALPLRFLASSLSRKCRRSPTLGHAGRVLPLSSEAYPEATRSAFLCVLRFPPDAGVRSGRFALSTLGSA